MPLALRNIVTPCDIPAQNVYERVCGCNKSDVQSRQDQLKARALITTDGKGIAEKQANFLLYTRVFADHHVHWQISI